MEQKDEEKELLCFEDFELSNKIDADYLDLIELIKETNSDSEIPETKQYIHSLFTPLLYYIIEILNSNEKADKLQVGAAEIHKTKIVYITLNKKIYDLFFLKKKDNFLNFEGKRGDENYKRNSKLALFLKDKDKLKKDNIKNKLIEYINNENKNEETIIQFEEDLSQLDILKKYFIANKKEIISLFRYGYVIQERFINLLLEKANDKVVLLPNLIFYQKKNNINNDTFREVDRILFAKENIEINNFYVYYKAEFIKKENTSDFDTKEVKYDNGEILKLSQNSVNFVEIKRSIEGIFIREYKTPKNKEEKKSKNDIFKDYSISENSKNTKNDINKENNSSYISVKEFLNLYKELNYEFSSTNIIFIFDSAFKKEFITISSIIKKNFINNNNIDFSFNLYFVHVEPDAPYIHEITIESKINELKIEMEKKNTTVGELNNKILELKTNSENKEKQLNDEILELKTNSENKEKKLNDEILKLKEVSSKLKTDSENKEKQLNNEIIQLKTDSENKEQKLINLTNEISDIKKSYKIFEYQNNLRVYKKKARKEKFEKLINEEFGENKKLFPNEKLLIGNIYDDSFKTLEHVPENIEKYKIIIDTRTFCRIYKIDNELEDDIAQKHFKKLEKYNSYKNKLILIVDYIFMKSFNKIKNYLNNCQISLINGKIGIYFKLNISKNDPLNKIIFNVKIPGNIDDKIDFNNIKNIDNFILYLIDLEIKLNNEGSFFTYPIYNPFTDGTNFYLTKLVRGLPSEIKDYKFYILDLFNVIQDKKVDFEPNITHFLLYISENFGELNLQQNLIFSYFTNIENCDIINKKIEIFKSYNYPMIYGLPKDSKYIIYDNDKEKQRILVSKKSEKIIMKIKYKTIFKKEIDKNIIIKETEYNNIKYGTKLALDKNIIVDNKIIYYISSLFLSISSPETNQLKILLNEDTFDFMEIYLKNIFNEKLEIINENKAKKVDYDFIKFLGKSNSNIINNKEKKNNNYDCIFLKSYMLPDEKYATIPHYIFFENTYLNKINNMLKSNGIFCFNIIERNKFEFTKIMKKLKIIFKRVIFHIFSDLDQFVICFKTDLKNIESAEKLVKSFSNFKIENNNNFIKTIETIIKIYNEI